MKLLLPLCALLVSCASSGAPRPEPAVADFARVARSEEVPSGTELRVRLDQDLGPGPDGRLFTARVITPLLDRRGVVIVPAGSLVHGHVIHVDEPQRRVELAFDRLETRGAVYTLHATVVAAAPYALTVVPAADGKETVTLQAAAPDALGGGPLAPESETDESLPRGPIVVPFDAELRLRLVSPMVRAADRGE